MELPEYTYRWKNNPTRASLFGRSCRLLVVGRMGSALIEMLDDGYRVVTSRRALRRAVHQQGER